MLTEFHIGLDDTDSRRGGCTTYTAAILYQELCNREIPPSDFPWLVRLNPNIPWKTRGNGALSIHLVVDESEIETIKQLALEVIEDTSDVSEKRTDPALVFLKGWIPDSLKAFSNSALHDVLTVRQAQALVKEIGAEAQLLKGKRGLVGALAAIGAGLDSIPHTFEIIAYRTRENIGKPRGVDPKSVWDMDSKHRVRTFHNLDPESGRILICPHGPDPVLLGIRGVTADSVQEAFRDVRIGEPIERCIVFRTNQGTDAHLTKVRRVNELALYQSSVLEGRVETVPKVLRGGHVVFRLSDDTGTIDCAAFAPTKSLTRIVRDLLPSDRVRVCGGISKHKSGKLTLNLEKIRVLQLIDQFETRNPDCPRCGCRCESMGRGQGFRCKKCGLRIGNAPMIKVLRKRKILQKAYVPVASARRHLASPTPDSWKEIRPSLNSNG